MTTLVVPLFFTGSSYIPRRCSNICLLEILRTGSRSEEAKIIGFGLFARGVKVLSDIYLQALRILTNRRKTDLSRSTLDIISNVLANERGNYLNRLRKIYRLGDAADYEVSIKAEAAAVNYPLRIIFDLLERHWGSSLRLLDLRRDSIVLLAVHTLVLDEVVESSVIGPDTQVLLDVFLLLVQLVLVEPVQHLVGPCALPLRQAIDLGLSGLLVSDVVPRGVEVLGLGSWASQNPALHTEPV